MAEAVVIDTGPLIALSRAEALDVASTLPLRFLCPQQVRDELDAGVAKGYPALDVPWLGVAQIEGNVCPITRPNLDVGEAAVIRLALERGIRLVCIDDWFGRRAATAVGLQVTGTLGLLGRAKILGLIPAVRPFVDRLTATGAWYDEQLVRRVLEALGE